MQFKMASLITLRNINELESVLHPLERLLIRNISDERAAINRYIQGRIKSTGGLLKHVLTGFYYRKLIIEEDDSGDQLNVILTVDNNDEQLTPRIDFLNNDSIKVNDLFTITNTQLQIDPLYPNLDGVNTYRAVCNMSSDDCKIVLISSSKGNGRPDVSKVDSPKVQRKGPYVYSKLSELVSGTTVNVFGVVKFVKDATLTRTHEYSKLITIVDESCGGKSDKLKCMLFGSVLSFPSVKPGQIIRFHRLKISSYNNELQGLNGPGFSWVVFDGSEDSSLTPVSALSANNTMTDDNLEVVKKLRLWATSENSILRLDPSSASCYASLPLSNFKAGQYFDLICQVVGTCVITEGESLLLKVWDGTKAKQKVHHQVMSKELESRLRFNDSLAKQAEGYLVDVWVFDEHFSAANKVKPGDFVKLKNLHAALRKLDREEEEEEADPECLPVELSLHRGFLYGRCLTILDPASEGEDELCQVLLRLSAVRKDLESKNRNNIEPLPQKSNASNLVSADLEEFQTPLSDFQHPGLKSEVTEAAVVSANGTEDAVPERRGVLDENRTRDKRGSPAKRKSLSDEVVTRKSRKVDDLLSLENGATSMGKENSASVEGGGPVLGESRLTAGPSLGFATDRCMLNTATVMTGHHNVKVTAVEDIIKHTHPYKFRFQGFATNFQPKTETASEFLRLYCEKCKFLSPVPSSDFSGNQRVPVLRCVEDQVQLFNCPDCSGQLEYIFMLEFILSDGTGWICVGLWRQEANRFFGCTPVDVLQNPSKYKEIKEILSLMCSDESTIKDSKRVCVSTQPSYSTCPVECCLMSYRTPCGVSYQMFDTVLAAETFSKA